MRPSHARPQDSFCLDSRSFGPFQVQAYIVGCTGTREALLIDPGDEPKRIADWVAGSGYMVKRIFSTHAHIDHVGAVAEMQRRTGAPFSMHPEEQFWLDHLDEMASFFGVPAPETPTIDQPTADGDTIAVGHLTGRALFTPGHSPGHVSLWFEPQGLVFTGDCLFAGGIGRTDFPRSDYATLMKSIRERLFALPDETRVFPGHGPASTIGHEREDNPFLGG